MAPVTSHPPPQTASSSAPLSVQHISRPGAATSLPPKLITVIDSPVVEPITSVPSLSPVPSTNESAFYQPYLPQAGDLLFSPDFILGTSEGGHTPSLFPKNYSFRASSQFVPGLSQEDAEFMSTVHGVLDLRPSMMAETMARQDSATLPVESDGVDLRWDLVRPETLGDDPGDGHRGDASQRPHEVRLLSEPPCVRDESSSSLSIPSPGHDSQGFSAGVSRWRSHTLDNISTYQLPSGRLSRQKSLRPQRSFQSAAEHAASRARSTTLNSIGRLRRSVSAALITASISGSSSKSSDIVVSGIPADSSTSPGGNGKAHDRLFGSAKRFLSGSGSSKLQAVHQQLPGGPGPRSDDTHGGIKGKGKANDAVSVPDAVITIK